MRRRLLSMLRTRTILEISSFDVISPRAGSPREYPVFVRAKLDKKIIMTYIY